MEKYKVIFSTAGAMTLSFGGGAVAADLPLRTAPVMVPVPMMISWSGLYAGLNAGFVGHQSSFTGALPAAFNFNYAWPGSKTTSPGGIFGAQLGYNFQSGQLVYGVEIDLGVVGAKNTDNSVVPYAWKQRAGMDAFGSARLRLGYAFDRALIYATGGLALGKTTDSIQAGPNPVYSWSKGNNNWRLGYTVGAGVEYALTDRWSAKLEGLYYDLGHQDHLSVNVTNGVSYAFGARSKTDGFIARLGINYKFSGGNAPIFAKY
ncbi:MAG: hypothetical protein JWL86_5984 [Rhizobium sp.]|nr:hypothetical protein [Rhizobium sp.]